MNKLRASRVHKGLLRKKLSSLYCGLKKWIFRPGRGVLLVIACILATIIVATVLVGIVVGCFGSIIIGVASIPALLLMFAFNWIVPAAGGPAITFKMSIGVVVLAAILICFLRAARK